MNRHPVAPSGPSVPPPGPDGVCITCSDAAHVAEIVEVVDAHTVRAHTTTGVEQVDTTLLSTVGVGHRVLVHAGTAIAELPEPDAAR